MRIKLGEKKMLERIYVSLIGLYFVALGLFFVGGILTSSVLVVFGLVLFGLVFLGMIGILPHYVTHQKTHLKH